MDQAFPFSSSLSVEETILISSACKITQAENKDPLAYKFWGRVYGTQNDYYIIQSTKRHVCQAPPTFYSRDGRVWQCLPAVKDVLKKRKPRMNGMFTGDPTFTSTFVEYLYSADNYYEPRVNTVKEEDRLAYLVHCIDSEGLIFPRGSVDVAENGVLSPNPSYQGMSYVKLKDLGSYVQFSPLERSSGQITNVGIEDPSYNVLTPLIDSQPLDPTAIFTWRVINLNDSSCIVLENVQWPGCYFWHSVDSTYFGHCYLGRGEKDVNIPFTFACKEEQDLLIDSEIVPDYDYQALPEEAIRRAEEDYSTEERRIERQLPPLPEKPQPKPVKNEAAVEDGAAEASQDVTEQSAEEPKSNDADVTEATVPNTEADATEQDVTSAEESEAEA